MEIKKEKYSAGDNKKETKNYSSCIIKILLFFVLCKIIINLINKNINNQTKNNHNRINREKKHYLKTKNFAILQRLECPQCGFFSHYIVNLGCMNKYISLGYIPIIDLKSFPNVYNGNDTNKDNPWELFFNQPYNFTLKEVKKYGNNVQNFECTSMEKRPDEINMYYQNDSITLWHDFAKKYTPIKDEIMIEVNNIMKDLFGDSKNILGVKLRGTDYIAAQPKGHSIPPDVSQVILDVKSMDKKYNYDFIFFSTEDELIKKKFVPNFKKKIKLLNPNIKINYNYTEKDFINLNKNINGNIDYIKNYILNTIILSKCLDIVTPRCSGPAGIFILTNGFRHTKIYNLGEY